jgi:signal peptidase I
MPPEPPKTKRSKAVDAIIEIVTTVGLAVVLYLVITTFVVQTFRVEQGSMLDTLQPQEHLLIDKITPRIDPYSRGDIIVFHPNGRTDETPFIKRVIAVGGERVDIRDGSVWINDVRLEEDSYTFLGRNNENEPTEPTRARSSWQVGENQLFVLGDHRQSSQDSRAIGPISVDDVVGRAWLRFFPLDTLGILQVPEYNVPTD